MGAHDVVADCAQTLRGSAFEFEQLLGACIERLWLVVGRAIERNLQARKGVNIPALGKLGFYKEQPTAPPVFLLADRFASSYGISWRQRPPPAPLTATSDINMAVLGNEAGIPREQAQQALDYLIAFIGKKLQKGTASGRLSAGAVGGFSFDGKALSFTFDAGFVRRISREGRDSGETLARGRGQSSAANLSSVERQAPGKRSLPRSVSLDGPLRPAQQSPAVVLSACTALANLDLNATTLPTSKQSELQPHRDRGATTDTGPKKHSKHRTKHSHESPAPTKGVGPVPQILPRFLLPDPVLPPKPSNTRVNQELVLQAAFDREKARMVGIRDAADSFTVELVVRQQATQLHALEERAEKIVRQRSFNGFLNAQIQEKRTEQSQVQPVHVQTSVPILPHDRATSLEEKRTEKRKLNKRLNDQVAAKAALKRDRRAVDQAEMAYFITQLNEQVDKERQQQQEFKRAAKQQLLADWNQQRSLRALQSELLHTR